jgi:alkylation response protein AidB-like acyl-CoA dehydrogenase
LNLTFTPEQEDLRRMVRRFLEDKSSQERVRVLMESDQGFDPQVWTQLAAELGLAGLAIPEQYGGAGCGPVEVGIVMEEAGRALLCAPYFSSVVLATNVLLESSDDEVKKALLPLLACGERRATVAWTEDRGCWDEPAVTLPASRTEDGWSLTGVKSFVLDGHTADHLIVAARTGRGVSLFLVDGSAAGLQRTPLPTMDLTRKLARIEFTATPARMIDSDGNGWAVLSRALDIAAIGLAAEQVGGAQRVLEMAVEYAKVRVQFGRAIGSFQAIKHKCADMLVKVESARSAAYYGLWAAAELDGELAVLASVAKAYCSDAYFDVAAENIQIHGGIGFTWEHPAHLYFKRAKTSQLYLGDPSHHRGLLAQKLGI